jgi:small subunit ribosomal protein S1
MTETGLNNLRNDNMTYYPEGTNPALRRSYFTMQAIKEAIKCREITEARVIRCDKFHNLTVDLGAFEGIIPRNEGALGIKEGKLHDIALISRVNKYVCCTPIGFHREGERLIPVLSRRAVQLSCQREYLSKLKTGDIINALVTRTEGFGAFIDIGAGINSLIPIDLLSVSRISHSADRVYTGEAIRCVLSKREPEKLTFSLRELLGTWEENAERFSAGETVTGIVRSVESYGVFVELAPNLAGLAERCDNAREKQCVSVYIKSINKEKMKIKLAIIDTFDGISKPSEPVYFEHRGHIDFWQYSPEGAQKQICTLF